MGNTNRLLKFQPYLVRAFRVIAIDNKKSKTINLYSAYSIYRKNYRPSLINRKSRVQQATKLGLFAILFTIIWGIHQGIVYGLKTPMLLSKKAKTSFYLIEMLYNFLKYKNKKMYSKKARRLFKLRNGNDKETK